MCPNYEVRQVFDKIQENILVDYITHMARLCYGLTPGDVRKLAYQTAERNNISKIPKSWKTEKMAGKETNIYSLKKNRDRQSYLLNLCSLFLIFQ